MEYMWLLVEKHELWVGWTNASMKSTYVLNNACKVFDKMRRMLEVHIYMISWYLNDKSMLAIHFNMNAHAIYVFLWWWHEVCMMMEIWILCVNYISMLSLPCLRCWLNTWSILSPTYDIANCGLQSCDQVMSCVSVSFYRVLGVFVPEKHICVPRVMSCCHNNLSQAIIYRTQSVLWLKKP